jgi:hypothetical protein
MTDLALMEGTLNFFFHFDRLVQSSSEANGLASALTFQTNMKKLNYRNKRQKLIQIGMPRYCLSRIVGLAL